MDRFHACHAITAKHEGGWSNHKADPGGKTMYGITEAVYHAWLKGRGLAVKPVRNISVSEAELIYREQYWNPTAVKYQLFPGVDLAVYDASVNSGVSRGTKWLKASAGSNDHTVTVKRICRARLGFMQSLKIWQTFGKGWGRRVADIEAKGVVMAAEAMGLSPTSVLTVVRKEAAAASASAKANDKAAKAAGAGAGGAAGSPMAVDVSQIDTAALWVLGVVAVALLASAIILLARKKAAKQRETAYLGALA